MSRRFTRRPPTIPAGITSAIHRYWQRCSLCRLAGRTMCPHRNTHDELPEPETSDELKADVWQGKRV